jgi:hypothetical protein
LYLLRLPFLAASSASMGGPSRITSEANRRCHGFTNLRLQIRHAQVFLEQYKRQLTRLRRTAGVEDMTLDFGIADRGMPAQFDYLPPQLLIAAGKLGIGIELSRYSTGGG